MIAASSGSYGPRLFEIFPDLRRNLPWTSLVNAPTPVERLETVSAQLGKEVWIKRDDKISLIYGGNKPRKLEFILAQASAQGRKTLVTGGGLGTNHGLATAIFGRKMNFQVILGLVDQPITKHVRNNLLLCHSCGAEMIYFNSVLKALVHYYLIQRIRRPEAYFIPMGGSSPLGTLGYVNAGLELAMQLDRNELPLPPVIFVAAGTCGTMAGLLLGLKLAEVETRVIGVQVAPGLFTNKKAVLKLTRRTLRLMRRHDKSVPGVKVGPDDIIIEGGHLGEGYGYPTVAARFALSFLAETEGIPLDLTYTAKTFGALLEHVKDDPEKGPVLFWNTFNSVDLAAFCNGVEYRSLPIGFHRFFEDNHFAQ